MLDDGAPMATKPIGQPIGGINQHFEHCITEEMTMADYDNWVLSSETPCLTSTLITKTSWNERCKKILRRDVVILAKKALSGGISLVALYQ